MSSDKSLLSCEKYLKKNGNFFVAYKINLNNKQVERANRLIKLRKALKLSRKRFAETFDIAFGTIQHWESSTDNSGLTQKGAHKLITHLLEKGIKIDAAWLLEGSGHPPDFLNDQFDDQLIANENLQIQTELDLFLKQNPQGISMIVEDDAMLPFFSPGDMVAGIKLKKREIFIEDEINAIITIKDTDKNLIRKVKLGQTMHKFDIFPTNLNALSRPNIMHDVELTLFAPIIWIRKKLILFK